MRRSGDRVFIAIRTANGERFIFLCEDDLDAFREIQKVASRYAANPDLTFSWYDAAKVTMHLRERFE